MQNEELCIVTSPVNFIEHETPDVVTKIQDFIEYLDFLIQYASVVLTYPLLPPEDADCATEIRREFFEIKEYYEELLFQETLEQLLDEQEEIMYEIECRETDMFDNELTLDRYLPYMAEHPPLLPQFPGKEEMLLIHECPFSC